MKKQPKFDGKLCSQDCGFLAAEWYSCDLYESSPNIDVELKLDEDTGYLFKRHGECIAEHGLDHIVDANKMVWSKEPPTDEGFYAAISIDGDKTVIEAERVSRFTHGGCEEDIHIYKNSEIGEIERYGPRIEFPELPEGE